MKHTPTPWHYDDEDLREHAQMILGPVGQNLMETFQMDRPGECEANAKRVVECVNAFEGIQDPALYMLAVRGKGELALWYQSLKQALEDAQAVIDQLKKLTEVDPIKNDPDEAIDDERLS